jgi:hypothetical protein
MKWGTGANGDIWTDLVEKKQFFRPRPIIPLRVTTRGVYTKFSHAADLGERDLFLGFLCCLVRLVLAWGRSRSKRGKGVFFFSRNAPSSLRLSPLRLRQQLLCHFSSWSIFFKPPWLKISNSRAATLEGGGWGENVSLAGADAGAEMIPTFSRKFKSLNFKLNYEVLMKNKMAALVYFKLRQISERAAFCLVLFRSFNVYEKLKTMDAILDFLKWCLWNN